MKSFVIIACLVSVAYFGYQKVHGPATGDARTAARAPSGGRLPVLQMTPEASAGLAQLSSSKVVFFSAAWCPHCKTVRKILQKQGVRFTEFDIERDVRAATFQRENMPVVGFPVTVIGSRIVMGSDEDAILAALKAF